MEKQIKVGPQHRVAARQVSEATLAGLPPKLRQLIAEGRVETYILPEEKDMNKKGKMPLRVVKSVCDCGRPIEGDHDLCGHCNVLHQARARGQALYQCMADCGAETPFNFCWHCNRLLFEEKAKAKQAWRVAHPDDPRLPQSRRPSSTPPASAPTTELTDQPCEHQGCEHFRLADSPFCYEHTLEQEELMAEMYGIEITVRRPRKICAHEDCSVEIDPRHTYCRPHHQLHQQAEREAQRAARPTKPCNKCGTPLPLTFVPDTCKACYEAGRTQRNPRYPVRPEIPPTQYHQQLLRQQLLQEYRTDRLRSGAKLVESKGQFAIVYDGKSYTFPDKGHTEARNEVRRQRQELLNAKLLSALKKGTLNKAWTVKEQGPGLWRLSYKGRDLLITDHVALEAAKLAETEKSRAEAERQTAELEARRQRHAELLTVYRTGDLPDDVVADEHGTRVSFLLEDGTVLEFEDPGLVAQAEAKRREADRIKREAVTKATAEAKAAKQAAKAERGKGGGNKKGKK